VVAVGDIRDGWRRQALAFLAVFALLIGGVAPLSPMTPVRIDSLAALKAALAELCGDGYTAPLDRKSPPASKYRCQVCITTAMAGQFLGTAPATLVAPERHGTTDWHRQPLTAPVLRHVVSVQPRGPPVLL